MIVAEPITNTAPGETPVPGPQSQVTDAATFLAAIGDEVRRHRAKRGMTRRQLAQASLTSERYLAQIESGAGPRPSYFCAFAGIRCAHRGTGRYP
jgi:ribosome-binding protein aMBF1 (putative translation factor)